ncbi:hypothetical protein OWV82_014820 [Melia azedarach]|uniref:Uncharacterized protein n=1 Tax=Melia azedarach TaxID=155640 RepID=A0ACC1XMZ8_MELAZ|nr:hypothetical protein OWV82_014820 [Melia azedarach]
MHFSEQDVDIFGEEYENSHEQKDGTHESSASSSLASSSSNGSASGSTSSGGKENEEEVDLNEGFDTFFEKRDVTGHIVLRALPLRIQKS